MLAMVNVEAPPRWGPENHILIINVNLYLSSSWKRYVNIITFTRLRIIDININTTYHDSKKNKYSHTVG